MARGPALGLWLQNQFPLPGLPGFFCMGLLPDMQNCGLRMRPECRESFFHLRLQGKPLVSDPGMHYSTCIIHVPWCMSGSLTRGGGENVRDIPGACISAHEVCFAVWIGRSSFPYLNPTDGVAGHCDEAFWRNTSITSFKLVNVLFSPYLVQVTIDIFIALLIGTGSQQGKHQEKVWLYDIMWYNTLYKQHIWYRNKPLSIS